MPTILLGFESRQEFGESPEGSLLEVAGIDYVTLPARAPVIQAAIDTVGNSAIGLLDRATIKRNAADLTQALRDWRHAFNGVKAPIKGGEGRLGSERPEEMRKLEYSSLASLPSDLIDRRLRSFLGKTEGYEQHDLDTGQDIKSVVQRLEAVSVSWRLFIDTIQEPFSEAGAANARLLLTALSAEVEAVDAAVEKMSCLLSGGSGSLDLPPSNAAVR
jgi:hypothetical protein